MGLQPFFVTFFYMLLFSCFIFALVKVVYWGSALLSIFEQRTPLTASFEPFFIIRCIKDAGQDIFSGNGARQARKRF